MATFAIIWMGRGSSQALSIAVKYKLGASLDMHLNIKTCFLFSDLLL